MQDIRKQVPHWVWLTAQFLWQTEQSLEQNPNQPIGNVYDSFLKSQNIPNADWFTLKNVGTVLMLLYGLIVLPKEIWGAEVLDKFFPFTTRKEFKIIKPQRDLTNGQLIKYLRNAVSHANFAIYTNVDQCIFWNVDRKGQKNFEGIVSWQGISRFLTEVGTYYINNVINQDVNKGW